MHGIITMSHTSPSNMSSTAPCSPFPVSYSVYCAQSLNHHLRDSSNRPAPPRRRSPVCVCVYDVERQDDEDAQRHDYDALPGADIGHDWKYRKICESSDLVQTRKPFTIN
ncbi:uncharacterized protein LOC118646763 [Monomorium pharaonis]|uniref:uncharacterized protein LOC118646763 n=1 Tax=Monomorium pharaonis TaxID=307658 RepID=UPI001747A187|nr:uncharacterized protein LOC118646763 [Monomorium pharaonis]